MEKVKNITSREVNVIPSIKRYFGYSTYAEYFAHASRPGQCLQGLTMERSWNSMIEHLDISKPHISSAEWIKTELEHNPNYQTKPVWYWVMPETRAMVPAFLLAAVDSCGAGVA